MSGPSKIMFIRHAEKPDQTASGVDANGNRDPESLVPMGWQRAGALVVLFGDTAATLRPGLATPSVIYASAIVAEDPSKRPQQTVAALANRLALTIRDAWRKEQLDGLTNELLRLDGQIVLVAWEHESLAKGLATANALARITRNAAAIPTAWPDDRFDVVWVFDRDQNADNYTFSQIAQLVLSDDQPTTL